VSGIVVPPDDEGVVDRLACPACGSDRVGTVETTEGLSLVSGLDEDGEIVYAGETIWHDGTQETIEDAEGRRLLGCYECGHRWPFAGDAGGEDDEEEGEL